MKADVTGDDSREALSDAAFKRHLVAIIPSLRAFARGLCSGRAIADDMVQEALMRAWAARASYAAGTNFRAWIFMILRNCYYTTVRKESRMVAWDPEASERILVAPPEQEGGLNLADVERALHTLSPEQREVLMLVAANSMSYEEAAQVIGCALGTVKSRLARGRIALQAAIDGTAEPAPAGTGAAHASGAGRAHKSEPSARPAVKPAMKQHDEPSDQLPQAAQKIAADGDADWIPDPKKRFSSPELLMECAELSDAEKLALLQEWDLEVDNRLKAEEEGMSASDPISANREARLAGEAASVKRCIIEISGRIGQSD